MKNCFIISPIGKEESEVKRCADTISDVGIVTQSIIKHILQDDITGGSFALVN